MEKGFPSGPKSHNSMYYYLKQRQIRRLVKEHKTNWFDCIMLVTGIRLQESNRRMGRGISVEVRRDKARDCAQVWVNPILHWSKLDCNHFIRDRGLRRNEVSDHLHRSGECLCGAYASPEELDEIAFFYPAAARRIRELEARAESCGLIDHKWAQRSVAPGKTWLTASEEQRTQILELCSDCVLKGREEN